MADGGSSSGEAFVLRREFAAPRDLVFRAFTEPGHLSQWWGPAGFSMERCRMDLRVGGVFHYCLRAPTGEPMWARFVFRAIEPPSRLVWVNSFSDESGALARHEPHSQWPLELLTTVTFEESGRATRVTVHQVPLGASEDERATFESNLDSMHGGWSGSFDQLDEHLRRSPR